MNTNIVIPVEDFTKNIVVVCSSAFSEDMDVDYEASSYSDKSGNIIVNYKHMRSCGISFEDISHSWKHENEYDYFRVSLDEIPEDCDFIRFSVSIYKMVERNQGLFQIDNLAIRVLDADTETELLNCKFSKDQYNDLMLNSFTMLRIERKGDRWVMKPVVSSYSFS